MAPDAPDGTDRYGTDPRFQHQTASPVKLTPLPPLFQSLTNTRDGGDGPLQCGEKMRQGRKGTLSAKGDESVGKSRGAELEEVQP